MPDVDGYLTATAVRLQAHGHEVGWVPFSTGPVLVGYRSERVGIGDDLREAGARIGDESTVLVGLQQRLLSSIEAFARTLALASMHGCGMLCADTLSPIPWPTRLNAIFARNRRRCI